MNTSSVIRKYIFYRYCFGLLLLFAYVLVVTAICLPLRDWLLSLPRDVGALIFTALFEITYLPTPAVMYFVGKWYGKKMREFYEKYGLGSEWFIKLHDEQTLKPLAIVFSIICIIFGIVWGYYFYTHWPNLTV